MYKGDPLQGPLYVSVSLYIKRPKSVKREYPSVKPDADNYLKALLDSLNGVLWEDDAQCVDITVRKRYGTVPGITLFVEPLAGPDSPKVPGQHA